MQKKLSELLTSFKYLEITVGGTTASASHDFAVGPSTGSGTDVVITSLAFDSRAVKSGSLFFALPGTHTTGNVFIPKAIENGAVAVVYEGELSEEVTSRASVTIASVGEPVEPCEASGIIFIHVESARFSMAPISACFFDNPSKHLAVIGVTGTEGKSSTVSFIWQLLLLSGHKAGFISTVEYSLGDDAVANPEHQTTPEAPLIQEKLYQMVENGCEFAVVESSSHGLSPRTNRTGCILFDAGVFMNVTLEHLEFHGTFEQYRDDKANLFRKLDEHNHEKIILGKTVKVPAIGAVNLDDKSAMYFKDATKQQVWGFSISSNDGASRASATVETSVPEPVEGVEVPDSKVVSCASTGSATETTNLPLPYLKAHDIENSSSGIAFDLETASCANKIRVDCPLPGAFNAYNLMAAFIVVAKLTETSFSDLALLSKKLLPVKGRMTVIDEGQDFEVIVDYAHTPSSFETIFPPIRNRCKGKMICVFGSGGERDHVKRPLQGEIAAKYCDTVILADEDPRGEDPVELLKEIAVGAEKVGKVLDKDLFVIHERDKAIRVAFKMAEKNDIVLLLGKAHENSIIYKDKKIDWDEITEARKALREMKIGR